MSLRALVMVVIGLVATSMGCSSPETHAPPGPKPVEWQTVATALPGAVLSVHGTAADDVWVAGAKGGTTGLAAHWDGTSWTRLDTKTAYDLWWVHAIAKDDVFFGGSGGTILHWDGAALTRMKTPGIAARTVYGIWAAAPNDVYAVGGTAGHAGFLWHYDGTAWSDVGMPDAVTLNSRGLLPSLFKIWGRSATDVYAVGSDGLMLHFDGTTWTTIDTNSDELLFTVFANDKAVAAVGGSTNAVVFDGTGASIGPEAIPLLQGASIAADGTVWACGERGVVIRGGAKGWDTVSLGDDIAPQSLHAIWVDPEGGVWTVGGNTLSASLDLGAVFYSGARTPKDFPEVLPPEPPPTTCPADRVDLAPTASIARRWNELLIDSIRRDIPRPGVHARNLFHVSLAIHDAWASYEPNRKGILVTEKAVAPGNAASRDTTISYAAYRVLHHRYANAIGGKVSADCYAKFLGVLGEDPMDAHTDGSDPVALGNRIGAAVIAAFAMDGANEAENYADITNYMPANPPLVVDVPGANATNPDLWQELNLAVAETQNGIILDSGRQKYIGSNWGFLPSFAAPPPDAKGIVHDWPTHPSIADADARDWALEVIAKTAALDHTDGATIDISPGAYGNNPLGSNAGTGHSVNPITGQPYAPNVVARGDFTRVLAEFWADGPKSETPPGHWFVLANKVSDAMAEKGMPLKAFGAGAAIDRLAWDVELHFVLGGAVHDAAITAWGLKRAYLGPRPITWIRTMAEKGQSSDPGLPAYHTGGLPLVPGLIELITDASAAPGERHHHLRWWKGQVAVRTWLGEPGDRANEVGPIGWMRGVEWLPYQRRTFVTPAFPGFVSGHSTFSRAAAEVLAAFTGSPYFPGGIGEYTAQAGKYLVFEDGPSKDVVLQWGTYFDAADQAGQSRIFGGIHIAPDDFIGRTLGRTVGLDAVAKAKVLFAAMP